MATKKCPNGHQYDSNIYGDNCPFCPENTHTHVSGSNINEKTKVDGSDTFGGNNEAPTYSDNAATKPFEEPANSSNNGGGHTVIRPIGGTSFGTGMQNERKVVGLLVSYSNKPTGEVYKVYVGRNIVGRSPESTICVSEDNQISSTHLLILYREVENIFRVQDQNSSNGTYINGQFVPDSATIKTGDVIVLGATKFVFLAIPLF